MKEYHILNGDALLAQFPEVIVGERIVLRECLVDGPVSLDLDELYSSRSKFIVEEYGIGTIEAYYEKSVKELNRIQEIPPNSAIYFWFEEDLFCQVNFWFALWLVKDISNLKLYLICPHTSTPHGFTQYNSNSLFDLYQNKTAIVSIKKLAQLWPLYVSNEYFQLELISKSLKGKYPFIQVAVRAHIERLESTSTIGKPKEILKKIIEDLNTKEFGLVFQEFNQRIPIYGFGDLQVKRLFDQIVKTTP